MLAYCLTVPYTVCIGNSADILKGAAMSSEYLEVIRYGEELLESVTGRKWDYGTTGGGCDAFFLNLHDEKDTYLMVTHGEDACIPETPEEWEQDFSLGVYDIDNDTGELFCETVNLPELCLVVKAILVGMGVK